MSRAKLSAPFLPGAVAPALLIMSTLGSTLLAADAITPERSSKEKDSEAQLMLSEIAGGNAETQAALEKALRLAPKFDVGRAFDEKTLVQQLRGTPPLRTYALKKVNETSLEATPLVKKPRAYVASATIWRTDNSQAKEGPAGRLQIEVCWINPSPATDRAQNLVRASVRGTWEYYGKVSFLGWKKCKENAVGIKILISDERPWSVYGRYSDPETQSMVLNFTFNDLSMHGCKDRVDLCIHSIAVHEFGHALGLLHEQDSPDTPPACKAKLKPADIQTPAESLVARMLTDWDEVSVMNYCFDIYSQRIQLSDCDVAAYQHFYGRPPENPHQTACPIIFNP